MNTLSAAFCTCGQVHIPPREFCITCLKPTKLIDIDNNGKLITFTELYSVPEGFTAPIILGIVEMDDEKLKKITDTCRPRIVCQGRVDKNKLEIGQKVKIEKKEDIYYFEAGI
jgi:uncharacterized OB-fold protein